MGSKVRGGSIW